MKRRIAIIGSGISGLAAASRLGALGFDAELFEKSRGVCGRAASRTKHGCRYDHGANYFTTDNAEVRELVVGKLSTQALVTISGDIVPFDKTGTIGTVDPARNSSERWTYRDGISSLGKEICKAFHLEVRHLVRIEQLEETRSGWHLVDSVGEKYASYDAVLITAPLPQAMTLVAASNLPVELKAELQKCYGDLEYFSQYSVVMNFAGRRELPNDAFALINSDREHAIAWISNEGCKPGHVPDGETLLVVQMAPDWSAEREGLPRDDVAREAVDHLREVLPWQSVEPRWCDAQWWRFAHPCPGTSVSQTAIAMDSGLFFAGDAFAGKGRVAGALLSGIEVAELISSRISEP
jgi:predicted NAD/FAD-dependent oxidoreductase